MKKYLFLIAAVMMATIALTSCDVEINNGGDENTEKYHAQIANTRWQLAEIMNQNNEWVSPEFYPGFDIPELSFGYSNSYFMKIAMRDDPTDFTYINGTYSIDKYFSITMTNGSYQGIAYIFKVTSLDGNILEGEFFIWGQERRNNIRLKRIGK